MDLTEELARFNEDSYYDCSDIAEKLMALAELEDDGPLGEELLGALYQLMAMAANPYNKDYWRVLYNILLAIARAEHF